MSLWSSKGVLWNTTHLIQLPDSSSNPGSPTWVFAFWSATIYNILELVCQLLSDLAVTASGQALPLECEENAAAVASGTEFVITGARVVGGSGQVKVPGIVGIRKFTLRFR